MSTELNKDGGKGGWMDKLAANKKSLIIGAVVVVVIIGVSVGGYYGYKAYQTSQASNKSVNTITNTPENGEWGPWGECYKESETVWKQKRTCLKEGKNGGKTCSQLDGGNDTRVCEPINGGWSVPADSDAVCIASVVNGTTKYMKQKVCNNPAPKYGGAGCTGDDKVECTAIPGNWSASFSSTSLTCEPQLDASGNPVVNADGRTPYYKTITCIPPKYGGAACPTLTGTGVTVTGNTAKQLCTPIDGVWSEWGQCVDSGSDKIQTRRCAILPSLGGLPCMDEYPLLKLFGLSDGGFTISSSSVYIENYSAMAWRAFDGDDSTYWQSELKYTRGTGVYSPTASALTTSTTPTTKEYRGEWIQIVFPSANVHTPFKAIGIKIKPRQDNNLFTKCSPRNFAIVAGNSANNWTVLYDNTTDATGIKDWTSAAKTIRFTNVQATGYRYYRLIVTRVGNNDSDSTNRQDSLQIAEIKILGALLSTSTTTETVPCNWSEWGAFSVNNSYQGTGTPAQFVKDQSYYTGTDYEQVSYIEQPNCPTNTTRGQGLCYRTRSKFSDWGDCQLKDGKWQKFRTNRSTNQLESADCIPTQNFLDLPSSPFRIKQMGTSQYVTAIASVGIDFNPGVVLANRQENNQIFVTGAFLGKTGDDAKRIYISRSNTDLTSRRTGFWGGQNCQTTDCALFNSSLSLSYDVTTKMIKASDGKCVRVHPDLFNNIYVIATCNINDTNQRFEIVSASE